MPSPKNHTSAHAAPAWHFWKWQEKVPAELEIALQKQMAHNRNSYMVKIAIIAAILMAVFGVSDVVMLPDVYLRAWAIRYGLVVPLLLLGALYFHRVRRNARLIEIEAVGGSLVVMAGVSIAWMVSLSSHPNAAHYHSGIILILLFGNILLRLRFRSALITSLLLTGIYAFTLKQTHAMQTEVRFNVWMVCVAAAIISLIANLWMYQEQRRAYLARMREEERNAELSHAVELLQKLSSEDALTQVANRREFDRRLAVEWQRARRDGQQLALIMIDVDFFKNYNDYYGHPAGDACLQLIAASLRAVPKRPADLVARFGGEEFVALLPATSAENAAKVGESMRQSVTALRMPHAATRLGEAVTISVGVASMRPLMDTQPAELLAAADAALYEAKQQGRNQVVVHMQGATAPVAVVS